MLVNSGIDVSTVNAKMADSVNEFLKTALAVGAEVPAAMKPVLQSMIDQGTLVDANGNKITDLADSGIKFSETMTEGFDKVVKKLDELIQRLGLAGQAIQNLPSPDIQIPDTNASVDTSGGYPGEGYASGTMGRYVDFGTGRTVRLHGRERVMTAGEAAGGSATAAAIDDLHTTVMSLPEKTARRLADILTVAPRFRTV